MHAVNVLAPEVGLAPACAALRIPRSTVYRDDARRRRLNVSPLTSSLRPAPPLAFSPAERQALRDVLCICRLRAAEHLRHPARRRPLPGLGAHHVPPAGRRWSSTRKA